jgi:hypothetical protein
MTADLRLLLGGIKSVVPSMGTSSSTKWTIDAAYCYAVWMRHLRMIANAGVDHRRDVVVELGPGDTLGTGFAALLTTAQRYDALDVVPRAETVVQVTVLEAIQEMVRRRAPIPDTTAFPYLLPQLGTYEFPSDLVSAEQLKTTLAPDAIERLRRAIDQMTASGDSPIRYVSPWSTSSVAPGTADLVFSQAVLQEIDNRGPNGALRQTFAAMASWLKPGGVMSHQIDLGMYGAEPWDRQWTYGDTTWSVIKGRRTNYINREPVSTYERLCREFGFDVVLLDLVQAESSTPTERLAARFRSLDERDRTTRAAHIVAVRRR